MEYTLLGKTGLNVSRIGLGGIPIQRGDAGSAGALLHYLSENGVNFLDTARGYTVSEQYIGEGLAGLRDKFILATKSMARTYQSMAKDIDTSLANLHTDHIELYQLHNIKSDADFETAFAPDGAVAAINDAIKAGKVGHLGATSHSAEALMRLLDYPEIETVMFPYNIVENQADAAMKKAAERNVGFIAMKPLAGGNITDGRLALRYLLSNPLCTIAIPGMSTLSEAEQNLSAAADRSPLNEKEMEEIDEIRSRLSGNFCRRCGYCAPCSAGIDIPSCFLFEGYLEHYDLEGWARNRYASMAAKAGDCIQCGKCEPRCPYNLPIRERLKKVKELFGE